MSDANETQLAYMFETTWGVLPDAPDLQELRFTKANPKHSKLTIQSQEVRADAQIADLIQVGQEAVGGFSGELSYTQWRQLLAAGIRSSLTIISLTDLEVDIVSGDVTGVAGTQATGTLTSDTVNVSNNDTVTIEGKVYTFKTALTPLEGEVLIGADSNASLTNLRHAINHTGTPGTNYQCAAENPYVSATGPAANAVTITARDYGTGGNSINIAEGSTHLTVSAASLAGGTNGSFWEFVAGQYVRIAGATDPENNGIHLVSDVSADQGTLELAGMGADQANVELTFKAQTTRNGTAKRSFLLEKKLQSGEFIYYLGYMIDTMALNFTSRQIATVDITLLGSRGIKATSSRDEDGEYIAVSTDTPMNCSGDISLIKENGTEIDFTLKSLILNIACNLRGNDGLGQIGLAEIGHGTVTITGTMNGYHKDLDLIEKYIEHEPTSLQWRIGNEAGTIIFTIPKVYLTDGDPEIEGLNTDVMENLPFAAVISPDDGYQMQIDFLPVID